ncbi:MAG: hypothetical protein K0Q65_1060 [Clostridia bacterium]|jgi:hypothetical protein|nr:hypothetical protein [Clostridia bacterium]
MNTSFSLFYDEKQDIHPLISSSQRYFDVRPTYNAEHALTLVSELDCFVIKISPYELKFIYNEKLTSEDKKSVQRVTDFINKNFRDETISFKLYCGNYELNQNDFTNVKIISLQ